MKVAHVVGPFELHEVVGRGGMGVLWSGVHRWQRTPVAFKVLTHNALRNPAYLQAFRNEVRSVAGLLHPGIVEVYEHGSIEEMLDGPGELLPGNPYLAMEWVGGGSLLPHCGQLPWPALRSALRQLLDALTHAHARGIVHRDLKPANFLRSHDGQLLKLTDFGIARWLPGLGGASAAEESISGTPEYMSPEQIECRWRDYGPGTDLYGLGCAAWEMACGTTPFEGMGTPDMLSAHLLRDPPAFTPRRSVPPGFEAWLRRLLEKSSRDRFDCAADAAWALAQLPGANDQPPASPDSTHPQMVPPTFGAHTLVFGVPIRHQLTLDETPALPVHSPFTGDANTDVTAPRLTLAPDAADRRAPLPATWRRPDVAPHVVRLRGAGLGLFGLRAVPLVGRDTERDTLWAELCEVERSQRARLVLITGSSGIGKTRLAEWLCEAALEVGGATALFAEFTAEPGPENPLISMLVRHHGVADLTDDERERRLRSRGAAQPELLSRLLGAWGQSADNPLRVSERNALLRRELETLTQVRPVVIRLDDVHWSTEAIEFARHLLDAQFFSPHPVLLLLTAEEEALAEAPDTQALLRELLTRAGTARLALEPVPEALRPVLVRSMLGLSEELTGRLVERTAGNPQMVVQLLSDWISRDLLQPHDLGFRFRRGAEPEADSVPATLREVWDVRLSRLLDGRRTSDIAALELAAVLGTDVVLAEWHAACAASSLTPSAGLVEALLSRRLARPTVTAGQTTGLTFVSAVLVECLVSRARAAGRLGGHHVACAAVLAQVRDTRGVERLGRHLAGAGRLAEALEPLSQATHARLLAGDYLSAGAILQVRESHLQQASLPASDPRWGEGWALRARLLRARGEFLEADAWAARAEAAARRHDWPRLLCLALLERGRIAWHLGEPDTAAERLATATEHARALGDARLEAECDWQTADLELGRGHLAAAADGFDRARSAFIALNDPVSAGKAGLSLGEVARQSGQLAEAIAHYEAARGWLRVGGAAWGEAECSNKLGEAARLRGDFSQAAAYYREASERYRALGSGMAIYPTLNMGVVRVEEGAFGEARHVLEDVLNTFRRQGTRGMIGATHLCLMACCAGEGDGPAFDRHAHEGADAIVAAGFVDVDNARMAELAGDHWTQAGDSYRAQLAWAIARDQFVGLGRDEDVARLAARLP